MNKTGWRVVRPERAIAYWAYDFDDAIRTICILGRNNPRDYVIQRRTNGAWVDVPHSL